MQVFALVQVEQFEEQPTQVDDEAKVALGHASRQELLKSNFIPPQLKQCVDEPLQVAQEVSQDEQVEDAIAY